MEKNTRITLIDAIMNIEASAFGLDHLNDSEVDVVNFKPRKEGVYYDLILKWPEEKSTLRYNRKFMAKDMLEKILDCDQKPDK